MRRKKKWAAVALLLAVVLTAVAPGVTSRATEDFPSQAIKPKAVVTELLSPFEGKPGETIQITLPIRVDEAWSGEAADGAWTMPENIAGMRVLLVEDNEINCEIAEYILRDAGVEVVTANDGKAAVDTFAASKPGSFDCVLMDLMMPVMSGYEASRVIRSLDRADAEAVPIIALSANAFEEDVALAKGAGMNAHLAKPVDIRKMFQVMSQLRGC